MQTKLSTHLCGFRKKIQYSACSFSPLKKLAKMSRQTRLRWNSIDGCEFMEVVFGVPQGSILGPLLFNIFINDLFLFILETELCNFADENTLYACDTNIDSVFIRLKNDCSRIIKWFSNNSMVANPVKFQLMYLGNITNFDNLSILIGKEKLLPTDEVKLLGVKIDRKLSFNAHIKGFYSKASNKISALRRIRSFISIEKA